jgi:hypothetical protein
MIKFLQKNSSSLSKKTPIFSLYFSEKILFQIITSVPGQKVRSTFLEKIVCSTRRDDYRAFVFFCRTNFDTNQKEKVTS